MAHFSRAAKEKVQKQLFGELEGEIRENLLVAQKS